MNHTSCYIVMLCVDYLLANNSLGKVRCLTNCAFDMCGIYLFALTSVGMGLVQFLTRESVAVSQYDLSCKKGWEKTNVQLKFIK